MMQKKAYSFSKPSTDLVEPHPQLVCRHRLCRDICGTAKGVAVCVVNHEQNSILLGLERFGRYRGKFNVCAGGMETVDGKCVFQTAQRELQEEFKLVVPMDFWETSSRLLFFMGTTPVFLLCANVNVPDLNLRIQHDLAQVDCPGTHKEMDCVRWMPIQLHTLPEDVAVSPFAKAILKRLEQRPLLASHRVQMK